MSSPSDQTLNRDAKIVFASIFLMLLLNIPAAVYALGWQSAAFNTTLTLVLFGFYVARTGDSWVRYWLVFGLVAGFTELIADYWLVTQTHSLVYPQDEPMVVVSPLYMPFAWAVVLLQGSVIAHWLVRRMKPVFAGLLTALLCSVNIPLYEHIAKDAGWWYYQDTPMIFNAPYYIIVGEFLLGFPLAWMALSMQRKKSLTFAAALGVAEGLVILVAYVIAWWFVGPCKGAVIQFPCG